MNKTIEYIEDRIKIHKISKESALKIMKDYEGIVPVKSYKKLVEEDDKNKEILIEINGKKVPLSKLPCIKNNCEWRYSIHCPKCEWNKNGKVKVY